MRILTKERKLTRIQAILWGLKNRSKNYGVIRSMAKTVSILAIDTFRTLVLTVLKICLVYPIRLARNSALLLKRKKATRAAE